MKYKIEAGRNNLALTIFVPWNCSKNCNFCTTKKEYNQELSNIKDIKRLMNRTLKKITFITDIVISGGEPLDNVNELYSLIKDIDKSKYHIFVNTSFPKIEESNLDVFYKIIKLVDGFNVSRHFQHNYEHFCSFEEIQELIGGKTKVRINILLQHQIDTLKIKEFIPFLDYIEKIKSYEIFDIQLRANYLKTSANDNDTEFMLHNDIDKTSLYLKSAYESDLKFHKTGCPVCSTISIPYNCFSVISYHKGLKSTLIEKDGYYQVNDVIIMPTGNLKLDWDGENVELKNISLYEIEEDEDCVPFYSCGSRGC
jgi:hypothetical protein cdifQCD-7_20152